MKYSLRVIDEDKNTEVVKKPIELKLEIGNFGFSLRGPDGELFIDATMLNEMGEFWIQTYAYDTCYVSDKSAKDSHLKKFQIETR